MCLVLERVFFRKKKDLSSPLGCALKRGLGTMSINRQIENEMQGSSPEMCAPFRGSERAKTNPARNKHRPT